MLALPICYAGAMAQQREEKRYAALMRDARHDAVRFAYCTMLLPDMPLIHHVAANAPL